MPDVNFIELRPTPPAYETHRIPGFLDNTIKLQLWLDVFKKTNDNIIFADCDMLATQTAYHAFDPDFDIAYTERSEVLRIPLNGGIVMTKPTEAAYRFMNEFQEINNIMFENPDFHEIWRCKYAGMNQAAFGCVLETGINGAKVHKYKTNIWNAIECDLDLITDETVFIHFKSKLRRVILATLPPKAEYARAMIAWYNMEKLMKESK